MLNCRPYLVSLCIALAAPLCRAQDAPDYRAQLVELIASAQPPGTNAWQDLADLAPALAQCRDEYLAAHPDLAEYAATLHDRDIGYDLLAAADEPAHEADDIVRQHASAFAALVAERLSPKIDAICGADRLVPPISGVALFEAPLALPSPQRSMAAHALAAQMRSAATAGDGPGAARVFDRMLRVAEFTSHQARLLEYLVTQAVEAQAIRTARDLVVAGALDVTTVEALRSSLAKRALAPASLAVEGERLVLLDAIDHFFYLIAKEARPDATPEQLKVVAEKLKKTGVPTAIKAERQVAKAEEYFRRARVLVSLPRIQRLASTVSVEEFDDLPPEFKPLHILIPALHQFFSSLDQATVRRAGFHILLAIELHKARRGDYPDSLAALVPEFFETLPADPYCAAGFVYRRIDAAADAHHRSYLLYSVGADGQDNGGHADHDLSARALNISSGDGLDFVINEPGS